MFVRNFVYLLALSTLALPSISSAQAPPPTPAPPMTLWRFLGIPQGVNKVHAQIFNRRGNFPALEKKPPLKAIADPTNLKSPIKAIEMAAKVKQDMDLAPQKIKAVKFLAKHACGCHNDKRGGEIVDALVGMLEDCTDDVRLATVKAIEKSTRGECCGYCGAQCCCDEKIVKKLAELAYEKDDDGCWIEPNEKIREAAAEAMRACCPGGGDSYMVEPIEEGPMRSEEGPGTTPSTPLNDNISATRSSGTLSSFINTRQPTPQRTAQRPVERRRVAATAVAARSRPAPTRTAPARLVPAVEAPTSGTTFFIDRDRNMAQVRLADPTKLVVGQTLKVYQPKDYGYRLLGQLEIVATDGVQTANVKPIRGFSLSEISAGTIVLPN